ncbi:MAG: aldo/keto reductase [Candidatus Methanomethylophilaceae archaeon]|nr:aldo/keto reductase [Candidatus Methanomethylophilaceae archaeon]
MRYAELGSTGMKVSRICVGGMSFGERSEDFHMWTLDQKETMEILSHCFDNGINFIDTANGYSHGTSESYIGNAIKELGVAREDVIIASKVYFNEGKLSREGILREIDGTLERLGTDYLDLYQIHRFDYDTPMLETMEALNDLVECGKVRAIGASAMYGYQFHNMQVLADENGLTRFSTMQNHYNLLYREDERELIPICEQYGVSRIPYSPLAGGHLAHSGWSTDSARSRTDKVLKDKYDGSKDNDMEIIERVEELSKSYDVPMSQIALAWHFKKGVTAPIVGGTKVSHLNDAIASVDLDLKDDDVKYLEEPYRPHTIVGAL